MAASRAGVRDNLNNHTKGTTEKKKRNTHDLPLNARSGPDMVSKGPGRQGARWRAAQKLCMAESEAKAVPCWFCGQLIDYELTRLNHLHRVAGTAHHIHGLAQGGDPLDAANLAPAHRGCNARESNLIRAKRMIQIRRQPASVRNSRRW
jgi:hypothetical protein